MPVQKKLFKTVAAAAPTPSGTGNTQEGLLVHYDANDVDSYDGDGSVWYDISDHEYTPATDVSEHFNTVLFQSNNQTAQSITGVGFKPDLILGKTRQDSASWDVYDSLRGISSYLGTNLSNAAVTGNYLDSFDADGFSLGTASNFNYYNNRQSAAFCFKAGGAPSGSDKVSIDGTSYATMTAASLTDGTEPISKLSVNTKLGFSIVTYTAPALRVDTVAHGLGETPEMIIQKATSASRNWNVFHKDVGTSKNLHLNTDSANTSEDWTANSTTFSIQDQSASEDRVAYCFASKRGVSKVGSFKGTGTAGNKIYTGFEPAFILTKRSSSSGGGWYILDNKRDTATDKKKYLRADHSVYEQSSSTGITFNRDGFTFNGSSFNTSGQTHIYYAVAKNTNETSLIDDTDLEQHLDPASYSGSGTTWTADTGNNATLVGNTSYDEELGDFFDLNGSGDYISLSTSGYLDGDFTIEMWWNFDGISSSSGYKMLWGGQHYGSGGTGGLGHYILDNKIKTWVANSSGSAINIITSGAVLESGKWCHIVLTRSGSSMVAYVDGENVGSGTYSGELSSPNTKIGAHYNATLYDVDGRVGQVRVYNSALTQDEIRQNFNFTKNDYPNGKHATITSATWASEGSFSFQSNQYATIPVGSFIGDNNHIRTITAWVKGDTTSSRVFPYTISSASSNAQYFTIGLYNDNSKVYCSCRKGSASNQWQDSFSITPDTSWHHIAVTFDGTTRKLYFDGDLQTKTEDNRGSATSSSWISYADLGSSPKAYIGRGRHVSSWYSDGKISDIKYFSTTLTDDEIEADYNKGQFGDN